MSCENSKTNLKLQKVPKNILEFIEALEKSEKSHKNIQGSDRVPTNSI